MDYGRTVGIVSPRRISRAGGAIAWANWCTRGADFEGQCVGIDLIKRLQSQAEIDPDNLIVDRSTPIHDQTGKLDLIGGPLDRFSDGHGQSSRTAGSRAAGRSWQHTRSGTWSRERRSPTDAARGW